MKTEKLKGKRILFIGVRFYDYNSSIIKKIEEQGATVTFFYERDISIRFAIINLFFARYLDQFQEAYYSRILKKTEGESFDYLLVIRGYKMPLWFVYTIKKRNPAIKTILYQWDSDLNNPFQYLLPIFDKCYSFDFRDVDNIPKLEYCPTFYTDEFKEVEKNQAKTPKIFDFFYFGSYLPERYKGMLNFKLFAEREGYTFKTHFYLSRKYYLYLKLIKGVRLDRKLLEFKPMKRNEYVKLFSQSKVIVDVSNQRQTGIAMRVIDALGTGKKVLTTNEWIMRKVNFAPNQIASIDLDKITIPPDFLEKEVEYKAHDYSLEKWVERIFN